MRRVPGCRWGHFPCALPGACTGTDIGNLATAFPIHLTRAGGFDKLMKDLTAELAAYKALCPPDSGTCIFAFWRAAFLEGCIPIASVSPPLIAA